MQAIQTKYLPPTGTQPSRIKATCERGSVTIPMSYEGDMEHAHTQAAQALVNRFVSEDSERYRSSPASNPWAGKRAVGAMPDGTFAHVFIG